MLFTGCEKLVDQNKVLGTWVIRKDSSEMRLVISHDSLQISYPPGNEKNSYQYMWKQDEAPGLMECYQVQYTDHEHREVKTTPYRLFVVRVSADSLTIFIPSLKTKFALKKES